jgi:hypothetical protein
MAEIPGAPKPLIPAFIRDAVFWEVWIVILATAVAIVSAVPEATPPVAGAAAAPAAAAEFSWQKKTSIALSLLIAGCTLVKLLGQFGKKRQDERPTDLEGCLHTLYAILLDGTGSDVAKQGLRLTIHRPVGDGAELEQVVDYVGDNRSAAKCVGRKFPAQSGIIGKAYRENKPLTAKRVNPDYQAYLDELISIWSYTESHAKARDKAAMAWMGIPIADGQSGKVLGILYGDSTNPEFFNAVKLNLAILACGGIARFVVRRYK